MKVRAKWEEGFMENAMARNNELFGQNVIANISSKILCVAKKNVLERFWV